MRTAVRSEAGLVRSSNEDYLYCNPTKGIFIVADGMGGHMAGEIASRMAVKTVADYLQKNTADPLPALHEAVATANQLIYQSSQNDDSRQGMGTTLTAAWAVQGKIYLAHVGDSRAYLIRSGNLTQLTSDHSYVGELMRNGTLTAEQALHHPRRNILMRAVGTAPQVEVELRQINLQPADWLLLCTDGLTNLLSGEEILNVALGGETPEQIVNELTDLAFARGASDNLTIVLVQFP